MKKFTKSIISVILTLSMLLSLTVPVFAAEALPKTHSIYETNKGIVIDNKYYTYDEFNKLLDTAKEIKTESPKVQTRSIGALVAGSFAIPGVGAFVVMLTSQTLPTQCHLTYKKSMALGYKLLAL